MGFAKIARPWSRAPSSGSLSGAAERLGARQTMSDKDPNLSKSDLSGNETISSEKASAESSSQPAVVPAPQESAPRSDATEGNNSFEMPSTPGAEGGCTNELGGDRNINDSEMQDKANAMPFLSAESALKHEGTAEITETKDKKIVAKSQALVTSDLECALCYNLLFEPTTTTCGHSFCRCCLQRALEHQIKCPICRACLPHPTGPLPISADLNRILQQVFPEETEERRQETEEDRQAELASRQSSNELHTIPCFILGAILPHQRLQLHIFEPRYRLMTQRCLQGNRRFGIVPQLNRYECAHFGTEMKIVDCEELPGGRYYLEVVGVRVFHIVQSWVTDDYLTSRVEFVNPDLQLDEANLSQDVVSERDNVLQLYDRWQVALSRAGFDRSSDRMLNAYRDLGPQPASTRPGELALWIAALLNPVQPLPQLGPDIRCSILAAQTSQIRLAVVRSALEVSIAKLEPTLFKTIVRSIIIRARFVTRYAVRYSWVFILGIIAQRVLGELSFFSRFASTTGTTDQPALDTSTVAL